MKRATGFLLYSSLALATWLAVYSGFVDRFVAVDARIKEVNAAVRLLQECSWSRWAAGAGAER